jgi:AcrR family transcriptional regulator
MDATTAERERRAEVGRMRRARTRARIVAAAFELFGEEAGLFARIEDVARRAGITRATFYDHFSGMAELREAVTHEVVHDFLSAVTRTVALLPDPRERASAAVRFYLRRVREVPGWGWSLVNLSANGVIFGAETHRQAEITVVEGIDAGVLDLTAPAVGRDVVLGGTLAAIATMLREGTPEDYPEQIAAAVLRGLGVAAGEAEAIARRKLPALAV